MIYFTADTHFCHSNIIHLSNRPFSDINEMNKILIRNWNSYISDSDEIYILGDLIYKGSFLLFHYPILKWQGFFGNTVHLYGHVHNSSKDPKQHARLKILEKRAFNVGVDVNDFFPVSIDRILKKCSI